MCDPTPELLTKARDWMQQLVNEPQEENPEIWDCDGTILRTPLGEACASALDLTMDDAEATIPDWVWDLAHEVAEWWEEEEEDTEYDLCDYGEEKRTVDDKCDACTKEDEEDVIILWIMVINPTPLILTDLEPGEVVPMTGESNG